MSDAICVHMQQGPSCNACLCLLFAIHIRVRQYLTNKQHKNKQQTNKQIPNIMWK
jgi:hypothetical protein